MRITKEEFVSYINVLLEFEDRETRLDKLFGLNIGELTDSIISAYRELLEKNMGDEYNSTTGSVISWWLYETNVRNGFGMDPEIYDLDGKLVCSLKTPEELYDYLIQLHDE